MGNLIRSSFFYLISLILIAFSHPILGQDSIINIKIPPIYVESTRISVDIDRSAIAVSKLDINKTLSANQNASLNEYINSLAGVFALNQNNSAQDIRISVRGFGARSAFGIRGIKILVDDVPYTTPDGQGQVDNILMDGIENIELIKGPASSLYGNASGGVLKISSFDENAEDLKRVSLSFGSYQNRKVSFVSKSSIGKTIVYTQLGYLDSDGYRQHSKSTNYVFNGKLSRSIRENAKLDYSLSFLSSPKGQDPGGVNLETATSNPRLARDNNISFDSGEELYQLNSSLKYLFNKENRRIKFVAYYSNRKIDIRLPFFNGGAVDLNRNFGGLNLQWNQKIYRNSWRHELASGIEINAQYDKRIRYENNEGMRGAETLNQNENFFNSSAYLNVQSIYENFLFNGGLRFDNNAISAEDFYFSDGDNSGNLNLSNFSPSASFSYQFGKYRFIYSSFSYGFETPTLNELTNRPDNLGGFNKLNPQQSFNYDLGLKIKLKKITQFNLTVFAINSNNELIPYELQDYPGRTFYQNTGKTTRRGLELELRANLNSLISLAGAYSLSNFKFKEYDLEGLNLNGLRFPGIPLHNGNITVNLDNPYLNIDFSNRLISAIYLDNENSINDDSYILGTLRISKLIQAKNLEFIPYLGVNNIYQDSYNDNIRINAFGGRFYEPGPGRNYYGGIKLEF